MTNSNEYVTEKFCAMRHEYIEQSFKDFKNTLRTLMLLVLSTLLSVVGAVVVNYFK